VCERGEGMPSPRLPVLWPREPGSAASLVSGHGGCAGRSGRGAWWVVPDRRSPGLGVERWPRSGESRWEGTGMCLHGAGHDAAVVLARNRLVSRPALWVAVTQGQAVFTLWGV
jgi:hypothetical protein